MSIHPETAHPETSVNRIELDRLVRGEHHNPHGILGVHRLENGGWVVRTLRPEAAAVTLLTGDERREMTRVHDGGVFAVDFTEQPGDYRLEVRYEHGAGHGTHTADDPYRWLPTLGEVDLHLIGEGRHERLWEALGAHVRHYGTPAGPVTGVSFAVWAPNARGVRVTGDFSFWDGRALPMRSMGSSGVWELFVPDVKVGARYKYQILGPDGHWREKADPMAFATEVPPATASVVTQSTFEWSDAEWVTERDRGGWHAKPVSVYEVHLGSWKQGLSYRQLADELVAYVTELGFTHVEFLPVAEHPFGGSWGYQVTGYYAPTSRFGLPDDFRYLVDRLHNAGIGVIVDWVPAHFPKDAWALAKFDGTHLYEPADPRRGEHPDWGTLVFDVGRNEVRNFLVANALYWLEEFHIDGLRVDAVASMLYLDYSRKDGEWLPNQYGGRENLDSVKFLQELNATVYRHHAGTMMVAEESTSWPGVSRPTHVGGLGFGFKWNMGWMHDTLDYVSRDPIHRQYHHHQMTFSLVYAWSENFVLPLSHDEVVHGKGSLFGKMPGDRWRKLAGLRALFAYMWAHPGKQLLFMGGELAQEAEWSQDRSLDWWLLDNPDHAGVQKLIGDLNRVYRETPALWTQDVDPAGFSWIDANDASSNVFSFLRYGSDGSVLACVANFAGHPHHDYRVGLPRAGGWREIVNTDADVYGGSGVGNLGEVRAEARPWHGEPASATVTLPPLGVIWLRPDEDAEPVAAPIEGTTVTEPPSSAPVTGPARVVRSEPVSGLAAESGPGAAAGRDPGPEED
ncbi:1,4-alpha-glucan branching protein GlgB [Cryptosporangium aurantiacum]|uniref:1,4-alpha-glucan branching enzyme GlgB n=1 Tax=Cryptosporangium aurantiacum TaxID=134849 RepID=A0A1M7HEE5_9ACTN|nr:1,4-alpha-glucan branching protein GlgB [Cryptosporangium aurantiacum]SHM26829.1 1,4-alpha-glucan branching enzyme [Cryptosporangium aurantiacum]